MTAPTPPQTIGPFFHDSLIEEPMDVLAHPEADPILVEGRVCDGEGAPVDDAMVEIWQADPDGRYAGSEGASGRGGFVGFGRAATNEHGAYRFRTVKPGPVPEGPGPAQAPHLNVLVFARGLLDRLVTRIYFDDEPSNDADPVLRSVSEDRRSTLMARREAGSGPAVYRFDLVLQGPGETVFFDA